jgi:hypothetical protein
MENNKQTILEVILNKDGGIEFHVKLEEAGMNYLTFIGLLEQLKTDVLRENSPLMHDLHETNQKYDA